MTPCDRNAARNTVAIADMADTHLVVHVVDALVEPRNVEKAMAVEKDYFGHEGTHRNIPNKIPQGRQLWGGYELATPVH